MPAPDFAAMDLPALRAWQAAIRLALAALEQAGGGDAAFLADAEGVSVTVTISCGDARGDGDGCGDDGG